MFIGVIPLDFRFRIKWNEMKWNNHCKHFNTTHPKHIVYNMELASEEHAFSKTCATFRSKVSSNILPVSCTPTGKLSRKPELRLIDGCNDTSAGLVFKFRVANNAR